MKKYVDLIFGNPKLLGALVIADMAVLYIYPEKLPMAVSVPLSLFIAAGVFMLFGHFVHWSHASMLRKAQKQALLGLDVVVDGLRYLGTEAAAIKLKRIDIPYNDGPQCYEQLCRTNKGRDFLLYFEIHNYGRGSHFRWRVEKRHVRLMSSEDIEKWIMIPDALPGKESVEIA